MNNLTQHTQAVARQRTGLAQQRAIRFLSRAVERAKGEEMFTGRQKEYLVEKSRDGCQALAYNGCCIIRSGEGRCVTVYPLPTWFHRRQVYQGKDRIRNVRKYMRLHRDEKGADNGIGKVW